MKIIYKDLIIEFDRPLTEAIKPRVVVGRRFLGRKYNKRITKSYKSWSGQEIESLKKLIEQGLNYRDIGKTLGRSQGSVSGMINRVGLSKTYQGIQQAK